MVSVQVDATEFNRWARSVLKEKLDVRGAIFNLVPYVKFLEYGTRRMAPRAMARVSLDEVKAKVASAVASVPVNQAVHNGRLRAPMTAAVDDATEFGRLLIRSRTPIETGRARRGWTVVRADDNEAAVVALEEAHQKLEAAAQPRIRASLLRGSR